MPSTSGTTQTGITAPRHPEEPASDSWDAADADTVTSMPDELPVTPRNVPPAKAIPAGTAGTAGTAPGTVRGPYQTSPGIGGIGGIPGAATAPAAARAATAAASPASPASPNPAGAPLPSAMREEVWAIVRAAVEEAMGPVVARQKELEVRAERAERVAAEAVKTVGTRPGAPPLLVTTSTPGSAASKLAAIGPQPSIPVAMASLSPELISLAPDASSIAPAASKAATRAALEAQPVPKISLPPQDSYGVTVMPSTRPTLDLDNVGAVDISGFDGSRRKKNLGVAVAVIIVLIVVGVISATLLSHS